MNVVSAMSFVWDTKPDFPSSAAFCRIDPNLELYR